MSLVRADHPVTLIDDHRYVADLPTVAAQLARSGFCPDTWKIKKGEPDDVAEQKVNDLVVIGMALAELDLRLSVNTLPQCYVVHGRPAFMAQIQIALAARHGCHIVPLDEASGEDEAVVKAFGKDGQWHRVSFNMAQAVKAGFPGKNPNYKSMPAQMLMARAVTKAITLHCPEAKFGLPEGDRFEADAIEVDSHDVTDIPELPTTAASVVERRTFFEALKSLAADVKVRAIDGLKAERIPGSRDPHLTSAQVARALEIIWAAADAAYVDVIDAEPEPDDLGPLQDEALFDPDDGRPFE